MINLRKATATDAKMVFDWRNDAEARTASRSTSVVEWAGHVSWFAARLSTSHAESIWIIQQGSTPIGSARVNKYESDDRAEISIVLAPKYRNRGFGRDAVKQLADTARAMGCLPIAFVRPENKRSLNTFLKAGFTFVDTLVELQAHGRDGRE